MNKKRASSVLSFLIVAVVAALAAAVLPSRFALAQVSDNDRQSNRPSVKPTDETVFRWQGDGLKFETAARPREKILAFYMGRGFTAEAAGTIVNEGCIFRSAIGSDGSLAKSIPVSVDLKTWRVIVGGKERPLRTRDDWIPVLERLNVRGGARIAFKWSLFPPKQTFLKSDYNWGLLSFGLAPGTRFDLKIVWQVDGQQRQQVFKGLACSQ